MTKILEKSGHVPTVVPEKVPKRLFLGIASTAQLPESVTLIHAQANWPDLDN